MALLYRFFGLFYLYPKKERIIMTPRYTYSHTIRLRDIFVCAFLCVVAFFLFAAPASAAEAADTNAATAVFGPTIANVPWKYIPQWYKTELLASGYRAPADSAQPPVAPGAHTTAASEVYGPTLANVPWKYVPAWYKLQLATAGVVGKDAAQEMGSAVQKNTVSTTLGTPSETIIKKDIGKESAATEADADSVSLGAYDWNQEASVVQATEARRSFMSETSFFFLGVFIIFLILIGVSTFKHRKMAAQNAGTSS